MTRTERWTLLAAILGSGIVFLDGTIVNLALPAIGRLPSSFLGVLEGQAYVQSGYLAVLSALLILAGALADMYGRRKVFAIGLAGFGVSSLLCGIAPSLELIVLFRILQGASGALLVPGSLSIITATFDGAARSRAFGIWAASTSGLALFGQPIGGLLVDSLSWRAAFLINVPLLALALWATLRHMRESRDSDADRHLDWLGAAVGAIAIGGLAFGATRGQQLEWRDTLAWVALGVGAVALVTFPLLMLRRPHPLVPLELFRNREFAVINLSTFLIYGALYVGGFYQSVLLQATLGYTATAASLSGFPTGLLLVVLSPRVGALAGRFGPKPFLVAGPLIMAVGLLWWARIPATSEAWRASLADPGTLVPPVSVLIDVLPALLIFGVGIGFVVAPLTTHADGLDPNPPRGPRLSDQQRPIEGRLAAHRGRRLHRGVGDVLQRPLDARSRPRHLESRRPGAVPAAQPSHRRRAARSRRGRKGGVGRRLPRGDHPGSRAAGVRFGGQHDRSPRCAG